MKRALQMTFRGMETSEALAEHIREEAGKLEQFFAGIVGCHVVIEELHRHRPHGNPFHVRVDVHVPGREIVVGGEAGERGHEDAYVAVSEAFETARRQLQHYAEGLRDHR